MNTTRPCGCKGYRTCLICEQKYGLEPKPFNIVKEFSYVYCHFCNKAWSGWDVNSYKAHPYHKGSSIKYHGVYLQTDFLSSAEETHLSLDLETKLQWEVSQSGRRKQNFGPKCNFKARKLKVGEFQGFPECTKFVQEKFKSVDILNTFQTIEQCSLEYDSRNGASIESHIDDCWIWGERIVTVNLLSDSCLTMTWNKNNRHRYNLDCVSKYPSVLDKYGKMNSNNSLFVIAEDNKPKLENITVRIPMPRRSLLVLYNSARYDWEHQVLRDDIEDRRVCLAYREFTPPYLFGGNEYNDVSSTILKISQHFW